MTAVRTETLRVVDGRRVEGAPPSAAVLPPPLRRARSREEEVFILLLDLGEDAPSHLYRELREVTGQAFWSSPGSTTAALRRAVVAANQALFQANLRSKPEGRRYGGITCVAVRREEAFLAQAGPVCTCSLCGGLLERFPREELPPLGTAAHVEVRLFYLTPCRGDTLLLGSSWLSRSVSDDALRVVLAREDMEALLDGLEQVGAGGDFSALVARWLALEPAGEAAPLVSAGERPARPPAERAEVPAREPAPARRRPSLRLPRVPLLEWLRRLGRWVAGLAAATAEWLRLLYRRMLPGRERRARTRPRRERRPPPPENPRLMAGVAAVIPFVVAVITLVVWLTYGSTLRHSQTLAQARQHAEQAREAANPAVARAQWEYVLADLEGIEDSPEVTAMRREAQEALEALNGVVWVEPILLWDFGSGIVPRRLVAHGQSLFVLDAASSTVYQVPLRGVGELAVEGEVVPFIQTGHSVAGQPVGELVDMAWAGPGGGRTADALVVLEEEGSLVVYSPGWGLERIYLGALPARAGPVAVAAYQGRLYLLDPQTDQIWRYLPEGGGYPNRPEPYFVISSPYPLDAAKDLAIDGNVYVLFNDGSVRKFYVGDLVSSFKVADVPDPEPAFVALAVNPMWPDGPVVLADGADERLVVVTADGAFSAQLRTRGGEFRSLQALAMDEMTDRLFILAGGRLYALPPGTIP